MKYPRFLTKKLKINDLETRVSSLASVRSQSHRPLGQSWSSPPSEWSRSDALVAPPRPSPRLHSYGGRETTTIPEEPPISELYQNDTLLVNNSLVNNQFTEIKL